MRLFRLAASMVSIEAIIACRWLLRNAIKSVRRSVDLLWCVEQYSISGIT